MRSITMLLVGAALALPTMAQAAATKPHHAMHHAMSATPRETVNDKGPFTPEANRAYNGGGLVTESAPSGATPGTMSPAR